MADEIVNADVVIGDVLNVTVDNVSETVTVTQTTSQEILNATIVPGTKGDPGEPGADAPSDHTLLTNIGTNTHAQIDTAISNSVSHIANTSNPHGVTKAQVGLSNVPNTDFTAAVAANTAARHTHANKTLLDTYSQTEVNLADAIAKKHTHANSAVLDATTASFTTADETKLDGIAAGAQVNTVTSVNTRTGAVTGLAEASDLTAHTGNTSNPHSVTKAQVGLSNADNTSDVNKPVSTATQTALNGKFTQRTITGTANQVTVTNGDGVSGNPTLALPQDIHTGASPTFNTVTASLTGLASLNLPLTGGTLSGILNTSATFNSRSIIPWTDSAYTLGTSSAYWSNTYTDRLYLNSTAYLDGAIAGQANLTGEFNVNGVKSIYIPDQTDFYASMFFGNGGRNLSHTSGNTGQMNNAVGFNALLNNTTGALNNAVGYAALSSNTTGVDNNAMGYLAMADNTTGNYNSAQGNSALRSNKTGIFNSALGLLSLYGNVSGAYNSGLGTYALYANTSGSNNSAVGSHAGRYIADGSTPNAITNNSVFIGYNTKALASNQTNQTVIGHDAVGNGSNTVTIGNSSVTGNFFSGNIESTTTGAGLILKSPDGTRYKVTVANGGTLTVAAA